jgi:hypothetical protein
MIAMRSLLNFRDGMALRLAAAHGRVNIPDGIRPGRGWISI